MVSSFKGRVSKSNNLLFYYLFHLPIYMIEYTSFYTTIFLSHFMQVNMINLK